VYARVADGVVGDVELLKGGVGVQGLRNVHHAVIANVIVL
jgi:hypothetical protein